MSEWQLITILQTPPLDRPFLGGFWDAHGAWRTEVLSWHRFSSDYERFATVIGKYARYPTHWMPLPEPPK